MKEYVLQWDPFEKFQNQEYLHQFFKQKNEILM
jgi:hypothetical protein